jgi:hypothetical protein
MSAHRCRRPAVLFLPAVLLWLALPGAARAAPQLLDPPVIASISPSSAVAGSPAFTITVNGSNFISSSTVRWNGADRATTFGSATRLTAAIPAGDVASAGIVSITVFNPGLIGGTSSNAAGFTVTAAPNPVPSVTSLNPSAVDAGGPAFTLTVNGTNFVAASIVRWNGADRATSFVNAGRLTAAIPASDIATGGQVAITVFNPAPGGGTSGALGLTINASNPVPSITSLSPTSANAGSPAFILTINGANFAAGSVVRWNGADRPTTFVSAARLTAAIPASDVSAAGQASVTVFNPAPGGGTSGAVTFTIAAANPAPAITSLIPTSVLAGGPAFTLTVNGAGFVAGSVVRWNGADRPTSFESAARVTAAIPAADIAGAGQASITVFNPAPGGGTSPAATLVITAPNPVPVIDSLNPSSVSAGSGAFILTVNGSSFVPGSVVRWNGADRATTYASASRVTAAIPASDVASAGVASITVFNSAPGGGSSGPATLVISALNPVPTVALLVPASVPAGSPAFVLTVEGTNFLPNSVLRWNDVSRNTTVRSATQLLAEIPPEDVVTAGNVTVTVSNPAPGGGISNAAIFRVTSSSTAPTIMALVPASAQVGSGGFTLTINGTGFVPASIARWNGADRQTAFRSDTQILASIPASDLETAQTASVTVFNPAPGGGLSNAMSFAVTTSNPVPVITSLNPSSATAGGPPFPLTVNGTGFVQDSVVRWNGSPRTTTLRSPTQLTAEIASADIASVGSASITVANPAPGGGISQPAIFTIAATPPPVISSLAPASAVAGGPAFNLTVNGSGFVSGAVVRWNGASRTTTFRSQTQLTADIPAADVAAQGQANVTVANPSGAVSAASTFTVTAGAPPSGTINGLADTVDVLEQPSIDVTTMTAPATAVSGTLVLAFTPTSDAPMDDPSVQFASGGRTVNLTVPAGSTQALFASNATRIAFQTGSVAGRVDLTLFLQGAVAGTRTITVRRRPPRITSLSASRSASGLQVVAVGLSSTRSIDSAIFQFTGPNIGTIQVTVDVRSAFQSWYQSTGSGQYGSQFQLTVPFTVTGNTADVTGVSATLTNSEGTSTPASASF